MKQVYKKKPEFLDVILVEDDTQSIREVYEIAEVISAPISFDEKGGRIITLDGDQKVAVGDVVFREKKSGKLVAMAQEKLLQFYDPLYDVVYGNGTDGKEEKGE